VITADRNGTDVKKVLDDDWKKLKTAIDRIRSEYDKHTDFHPTAQMCTLLILGEDRRFEYHPGVDPIALCRAAWKTYVCGCREGGSTIAMQLVRTVTGRYEKTLARKILEVQLALRLSKFVPKKEIPPLYLWVAYYGWRMNNFVQACNRVGLDPESTTLLDAANLVARLKYPQPRTLGPERARQIEQRCHYLIQRYRNAETCPNPSLSKKNGTLQSRSTVSEAN
jgi:penicillin-binding protein 1A